MRSNIKRMRTTTTVGICSLQSIGTSPQIGRRRRRRSNKVHITDLPDGILVSISSYLAKPSTVLFAIATSSNSQQHTQTSKAIISSINWNVLDFGDIEKSLASKLSDDHIDKILKSIDAVNNLHILKLAGCINITGSGLNVLRSSTTIKQIDLSLVGKHEVPLLPEPLLSEIEVISILYDIIGRGRGSSLKQLEFLKKWRNIRSTQFDQFLERYNDYLTNKRFCCSKCDKLCEETDPEWIFRSRLEEKAFGTQNYTCSGCLKHFCRRGECGGDVWCDKCEKQYCEECSPSTKCQWCDLYFCNACEEMNEIVLGYGGTDLLCDECLIIYNQPSD